MNKLTKIREYYLRKLYTPSVRNNNRERRWITKNIIPCAATRGPYCGIIDTANTRSVNPVFVVADSRWALNSICAFCRHRRVDGIQQIWKYIHPFRLSRSICIYPFRSLFRCLNKLKITYSLNAERNCRLIFTQSVSNVSERRWKKMYKVITNKFNQVSKYTISQLYRLKRHHNHDTLTENVVRENKLKIQHINSTGRTEQYMYIYSTVQFFHNSS